MMPNFDKNALTKLAERTEYESWFLEAVYALVENELFPTWPDAVIYPLDRSKAQFFMYARGNINIGDWRPGFLKAGAPLVFISAFKILDMLVEWVLEENGINSGFRFQEKIKQLKKSITFPSQVESRTWLKERIIGLFETIDPLRGTIIHHKQFTSINGDIEVSSTRKGEIGPPVKISEIQLRILARTVVSLSKYIDGTWDLDEFREKMLRRDLDELATLHGLPSLGQKYPYHTCVRVYSIEPDPLQVNPVAIRKEIDSQYASRDCSFDLHVLIVTNGEVVDAYKFPWSIVKNSNADWNHAIDADRYKAAIPTDINPEHVLPESCH